MQQHCDADAQPTLWHIMLQVSLEDDGGRLRVEAFDARVGRRGHIRMRGQLPLQPPPRRCDPLLPAFLSTLRVMLRRTGLVLVISSGMSSNINMCSDATLPCTYRMLQQQPIGSEPAAISVDLHNLELRARNLYTGTQSHV